MLILDNTWSCINSSVLDITYMNYLSGIVFMLDVKLFTQYIHTRDEQLKHLNTLGLNYSHLSSSYKIKMIPFSRIFKKILYYTFFLYTDPEFSISLSSILSQDNCLYTFLEVESLDCFRFIKSHPTLSISGWTSFFSG